MLSITARDIHVEFPIYDQYRRSLKHALGLGHIARSINRFASRNLNVGGQIGKGETGKVVIKALDGLSFDIQEGDHIGVLGHNGSGKTTLLRTLAGIYEPVGGEIRTSGHVVPLFDLQLGMDPYATGLENIWMRGKMLRLSDRQIQDALDDIVDFTELGDYLYVPIRAYSTGMMVRLAFAISTAITPEILILDEMIGAGDAAFIARAELRLKNFIEKTGILVVASHSNKMLREWCNKGILLERGKLIAFGPIKEVVTQYERATGTQPSQLDSRLVSTTG
jgi:ABC-2 type transport system ATP-binding protein/lipopolysaccharide transport system ATP-binding protein